MGRNRLVVFTTAGALLFASSLVGGCVAPEDDGVGRAYGALDYCPRGETVDGIDVSRWQGDIDWDAVAGSGIDFAITRIGDGLYEDPTFPGNYEAIAARGMVRGSYQFFRPVRDAMEQADIVIRYLGRLGPGDLPAVIDVENTPGDALPSRDVMRAQVRAWIDRVREGTGKTPMIYTGPYFWDDNVASTDFADNPLWIAHWGVTCARLPTGWTSWVFHQTSDSGSIPGISGNVDTDVFDGTRAELDAFAAGGSTCSAHCEGEVLVGADCARSDCAAFGTTCVDDAVGVRCVSPICPREGNADVCASATEIAHCTNGMIGSSSACAAGERCASDASGTRCVADVPTDAGPGTDAGTPPPPPGDAGVGRDASVAPGRDASVPTGEGPFVRVMGPDGTGRPIGTIEGDGCSASRSGARTSGSSGLGGWVLVLLGSWLVRRRWTRRRGALGA
ncbi:MAG: glycoside hydrolase family 25 protein [Deltaproteobacteria bacterium]|nr:glycoside hydrolase family 25 protein [Deltaproteobacteria bacterium]